MPACVSTLYSQNYLKPRLARTGVHIKLFKVYTIHVHSSRHIMFVDICIYLDYYLDYLVLVYSTISLFIDLAIHLVPSGKLT